MPLKVDPEWCYHQIQTLAEEDPKLNQRPEPKVDQPYSQIHETPYISLILAHTHKISLLIDENTLFLIQSQPILPKIVC